MKHGIDISGDNRQLGDCTDKLFRRGLIAAAIGGVASLGLAFASSDGFHRLAWSYLVAFAFGLSFALGALIWVLIQHTTKAGWSVAVRRLVEGVMGTLHWIWVLFIPVLLFAKDLYHWMDHEAVKNDPILTRKMGYLNPTFFYVRIAIYFLLWLWLARFFGGASREQDKSGDPGLTRKMEKLGPVAVLIYALTATFFAFDVLMSLDPHWFSTIFGVYFFAGSFFAINALLCVMVVKLQKAGRLTNAIRPDHYHDIGKLMFAFTVFWAYIAFSQFMLIWYGNLPEETAWVQRRYEGPWGWMSVLLLFGHFLIPFLLLISRIPKRRPNLLVKIAYWNLFIHYIDIYWLVMPEMHKDDRTVHFHLLDLTTVLFVGGVITALLAKQLGAGSLLAEKDPRLPESLSYHNA